MSFTREQARATIGKAYRDNQLAAQRLHARAGYRPAYRDPAFGPCAVGAMLNDEQAALLDTGGRSSKGQVCSVYIGSITGEQRVTEEARALVLDLFGGAPGDLTWFAEVQQAHDKWAGAVACMNSVPANYELTFCEALGIETNAVSAANSISGHPVGSYKDMQFHRERGDQIKREDA